jgi:hypothetical protein
MNLIGALVSEHVIGRAETAIMSFEKDALPDKRCNHRKLPDSRHHSIKARLEPFMPARSTDLIGEAKKRECAIAFQVTADSADRSPI